MNDVIWALIGESVKMISGLLIALGFIISMYISLFDGHRTERFSSIRRVAETLARLNDY